jgi:hypothetical protein
LLKVFVGDVTSRIGVAVPGGGGGGGFAVVNDHE